MKKTKVILRTLFGKRQGNFVKIISLGAGLAVSIILATQVSFHLSFDNFYPDKERIYRIISNTQSIHEEPGKWGNVSGGVAPGMKAEIAAVEEATRVTSLGYRTFSAGDIKDLGGKFGLADEHFFDILPRPVISGDPTTIFSTPMQAMVSRSTAAKLGPDVLGRTLVMDSYPGREITVQGVFEDYPVNSNDRHDILVSLPSIGRFAYDGRDNWDGNDRYWGYVRLAPRVKPESLAPAMRAMQEKYQQPENYMDTGFGLYYSLLPLTKAHTDDPDTRKMLVMLSLLAFVILAAALVNYILVVVSSLISRSKLVAVRKCYGAEARDIYRMQFTEALAHILLSLAVAAALILVFRATVEQIIGMPVSYLINRRSLWLVCGICLAVLFISVYVPARTFISIPPVTAFRNARGGNRLWKRILLLVQFAGTAYVLVLLSIITVQHRKMVNADTGYDTRDVFYVNLMGTEAQERETLIADIEKLPGISAVSHVYNPPFYGSSGNYVFHPEDGTPVLYYADLYEAGENYLRVLGVELVEGRDFISGETGRNEALVSREFSEKLAGMLDITDGIVGKSFRMGEHGMVRIRGVYEDYLLGSHMYKDYRPSAMFFSESPMNLIVVKTSGADASALAAAQGAVDRAFPERKAYFTPFSEEISALYEDSRKYRISIMVAGIVILIIAFTGLVGYLRNETARRSPEIAIRKVSGASSRNILSMFSAEVFLTALPAVVAGGMAAMWTASSWMADFSIKTPFSGLMAVAVSILLLAVITCVTALLSRSIAASNPVEAMKTE